VCTTESIRAAMVASMFLRDNEGLRRACIHDNSGYASL
jgi:hypothetical protein